MSKKDKATLLRKLNRLKREMQQDPFYNDWQVWLLLPDEQKKEIQEKWDKYYEDVKETPIYALFQEQREAARKNNYTRVKELAAESREMRKNGDHITLEKPKATDPFEYNNSTFVHNYRSLKRKISDLNQWEDEVPDEIQVQKAEEEIDTWEEPPTLS